MKRNLAWQRNLACCARNHYNFFLVTLDFIVIKCDETISMEPFMVLHSIVRKFSICLPGLRGCRQQIYSCLIGSHKRRIPLWMAQTCKDSEHL